MKVANTVLPLALLLAAGCIQSHRAPVVYTPPPVYNTPPPPTTPPPPVPTSPRPEVRVYPPDTPPGVAVPPGPVVTYSSEADQAIAASIRRVFSADTTLSSGAERMRMSVQDGRVTLTGTAPSENARQIVERAISQIAGVTGVDDRTQVDLH